MRLHARTCGEHQQLAHDGGWRGRRFGRMMHSGAGGGLREKTKTGGFLLQQVVDASKGRGFC